MSAGGQVISTTVMVPLSVSLVKYWGNRDEELNLPLNSSISLTLDASALAVTATVCTSQSFARNRVWYSGKESSVSPRLHKALAALQNYVPRVKRDMAQWPVHMATSHNLPGPHDAFDTDAIGQAAIIWALSKLLSVPDECQKELAVVLRNVAGDGFRSVLGGIVSWGRGYRPDGTDSICQQIAPEFHWPELCAAILFSSTTPSGQEALVKPRARAEEMRMTLQTSPLNQHRYASVSPARARSLESSINQHDFDSFAQLIMAESNTLQACLMDTMPPMNCLNETSKRIVEMVHRFNDLKGYTAAAYTFDTGPDAVLIFQRRDAPELFQRLLYHFPPACAPGEQPNVKAYFSNSDSLGEALTNGWTDVGAMHPPKEVYGEVYAAVGNMPTDYSGLDVSTLAMAMRWPGALQAVYPIRPGGGACEVSDQTIIYQQQVLNPVTGLPYGWGTAANAQAQVAALMPTVNSAVERYQATAQASAQAAMMRQLEISQASPARAPQGRDGGSVNSDHSSTDAAVVAAAAKAAGPYLMAQRPPGGEVCLLGEQFKAEQPPSLPQPPQGARMAMLEGAHAAIANTNAFMASTAAAGSSLQHLSAQLPAPPSTGGTPGSVGKVGRGGVAEPISSHFVVRGLLGAGGVSRPEAYRHECWNSIQGSLQKQA
ncbi:hypothetical protein CYMTET_11314 [Cymbomonas tetramitiformis]|uniref:Diphosphomevalonate decarboxylase n=1 Tax=Cymbomonas tetramitiformis TaxID=36881 RepID=A0AAE0GMS8_9CHLO|nr:hypothetical protein CYMTET_11314 [Cymbomonas tetramitiformis]